VCVCVCVCVCVTIQVNEHYVQNKRNMLTYVGDRVEFCISSGCTADRQLQMIALNKKNKQQKFQWNISIEFLRAA
jgi:hypothetical protein